MTSSYQLTKVDQHKLIKPTSSEDALNGYNNCNCVNILSNNNATNVSQNESIDLRNTQNTRPNQIRNILHLPLPPLTDYTPYPSLEFDLLVQEYCRIQNAHLRLSEPSQASTEDNNSRSSTNSSKSSNRLGSFDYTGSNKSAISGIAQRYQNAMLWPMTTSKNLRSCKVIVSGDVAVGKTCLVNRFGQDIYTNKYQTTIGVDFDIQKYNILGLPYTLQIWDTAGLERFKSINSSYYRGCHAALLVFDMTNISTMANIIRWKDEILSTTKTHGQMTADQISTTKYPIAQDNVTAQPMLFLVGTKCDLPQAESNRRFMRDQANKLAALIKAELWFVSSETGDNINELFNRVAALSFNNSVSTEVRRIKFETSTIGASLKEKLMQQQKDLFAQSNRLIKITKRRDGDDRRSRCINVQCVIK